MMNKRFAFLIGMMIPLIPITLKAQCSGSWTPVSTLNYLCANGPFLQYDLGVNNCPSAPQALYTFTTPVQSIKLTFSAFGTAGTAGQSRMAVFLNDTLNKIDLTAACRITLGCQTPIGTYAINNGCLVDSISGADGGISGFIYLEAASFGLPSISSMGVAVSEPGSSGTIFAVDSCNGLFECLTGFPELTSEGKVIYPNPFTDNLTINSRENEIAEVVIYDISLRVVLKKTFQKSILLDTEYLEKGMYIYTVSVKQNIIETGKIIKD